MEKRAYNTAFYFTIAGIFAGAFYREFTKFLGFVGPTSMSVMHTHLLTTGTFMFLLLGLSFKVFNISSSKKMNNLLTGYTISVIVNVLCMFTRGLYEVMGWEITNMVNGMISGISGVSHILLTITLIWILNIVRKSVKTV